MFTRSIVWKGIAYSVLMIIGKGLVSSVIYVEHFLKIWRQAKPSKLWRKKKTPPQAGSMQIRMAPLSTAEPGPADPDAELTTGAPHFMALLVGLAMVARGEIGFLIASLSQSSGTLTQRHQNSKESKTSGEEIFLVIIWAVVICTVIGPLGVGVIVRRMRA